MADKNAVTVNKTSPLAFTLVDNLQVNIMKKLNMHGDTFMDIDFAKRLKEKE